MKFGEVKQASGFQVPPNNGRPFLQIWQPGDGPEGGENDVEFFVEHLWQIIYIGGDETGIVAKFRIDFAGLLDGIFGEINARHFCSTPRPTEAVLPEMALEVEHRFAGNIAQGIPFNFGEGAFPGHEIFVVVQL